MLQPIKTYDQIPRAKGGYPDTQMDQAEVGPGDDSELDGGGSRQNVAADGGILRKKLYNQPLSDWTARYRKNKQHLDNCSKDCEQLRVEVSRQQQEVDEREETYRCLEDKFQNDVLARYQDTKSSFDMAMQQKGMLSVQISENRKHKTQMTREKKMLTADYERKHAELMRMTEERDKLGNQLDHFLGQLRQLNSERHRMERELDEVTHNLRAHSELADEVNSEINHVQDGIKDSMHLHMGPDRPSARDPQRAGDGKVRMWPGAATR